MRRAPQYAHLNARKTSRNGAQKPARHARRDAVRPRAPRVSTRRARRAGTPPAAHRQRIGSASAAFRPHPLADPVKLHVSAH
ncbi:hypothetical protein [Burkholderia vietnamiensis]|uniref:hypothetical protein n=1 Tax=Burkholderia vietnamiensis TaxID=60552 RepID=UPI000A728E92|nr:hypothetical protein [Burkholderia vietnamiensis]